MQKEDLVSTHGKLAGWIQARPCPFQANGAVVLVVGTLYNVCHVLSLIVILL